MSVQQDFYQVLGLENQRYAETLTTEEIKKAYKHALLKHHPDKQQSEQRPQNSSTIDDITRAFRTLLDPTLRAEYDQKIRADERTISGLHGTRHTGIETVDLDELDYDETTGLWNRSCRCGSNPAFVVTEAELEKNVEHGELFVGCKGCSLWLKVLFSAET